MKRQWMTAVVLLGVAQVSLADLRIPGTIFEMEKLEEAKVEAARDKKPLIFVYTDPGTS